MNQVDIFIGNEWQNRTDDKKQEKVNKQQIDNIYPQKTITILNQNNEQKVGKAIHKLKNDKKTLS